MIAGAPESRALLVSFGAAWCTPCRRETPSLRALAAAPPGGLAVVLRSHDEQWSEVVRFFGGTPEPALHFRMDTGKSLAAALGVTSIPVAFLVVEGRLVARFDGPRAWDSSAMRRLLTRLSREGARVP